MIGGGTGPATGTKATTCTPGPWHVRRMYEAVEAFPLNFGFLGKGNASGPDALREQVRAGALGLKLHEDWGTTPAAIDQCLTVADEFDVQVAIHTDTLNEAGFVEDTIAAFRGRTIHTYHTEGAGGGHAPDINRLCGEPNVLPSSTNPTMPFTRNTLDEHLDMLMVCHHLSPNVPEDVAFADSRIRPETIAAEDVLHDLGAFSMMSSDSQAMGRIGEVICRTWQTADKMKRQRGPLPGEQAGNDNMRVRRYIAKYTINPAITHGIAAEVGSIAERRVDRLLDPHRSQGLPPFLAHEPGVNSGLMVAQYTAAALVAENRRLAAPASVDSVPTSGMQEDHVSMGWGAALKLRTVLDNLAHILAVELCAAVRAQELRRPLEPSPATAAVRDVLRQQVAGSGPDRVVAPELAAAQAMIRSGAIIEAAESVTGRLR